MSFLPIYYYFIVVSFIASLFTLKNKKFFYLKYFSALLFVALLVEFIGPYLASISKNNMYIYNFFSVFEFVFYMFIIQQMISNAIAKRVITITMIIYPIIAIINILFIQGVKRMHTITYAFGCLLIVIACIYYFLELFRHPKSINLSADPAFWLCSGLLFYYCCSFPLFAFVSYWAKYKWMVYNFDIIITILNIFLYTLFTIAFLCSRTRKSISLSL